MREIIIIRQDEKYEEMLYKYTSAHPLILIRYQVSPKGDILCSYISSPQSWCTYI